MSLIHTECSFGSHLVPVCDYLPTDLFRVWLTCYAMDLVLYVRFTEQLLLILIRRFFFLTLLFFFFQKKKIKFCGCCGTCCSLSISFDQLSVFPNSKIPFFLLLLASNSRLNRLQVNDFENEQTKKIIN